MCFRRVDGWCALNYKGNRAASVHPCVVPPNPVSTPAARQEDTIVTVAQPLIHDAGFWVVTLLGCLRWAFNFGSDNKSLRSLRAWDTCRGWTKAQTFHKQFCHSSAALSYRTLPKRESPLICATSSKAIHYPCLHNLRPWIATRKTTASKKMETVCLGRGDFASAGQMFIQLLVDWRQGPFKAGECYLCIGYMLVGFQLVTKKKTKCWVPAQQGGPGWRGKMLSSSIRKQLPQI